MRYALASLLVLGGVLVAVTPRHLVPTCEFSGHSRMHCSDAARLWAWDGALLAAAGTAAFLLRGGAAAAAGVTGSLLALAAVFVPAYTGYCASPRMPCHYGTVPAMRFLGGALALLAGGLGAALALRKGRGAA